MTTTTMLVAVAVATALLVVATSGAQAQVPCGNLCYDLLVPSYNAYSSAVDDVVSYSDNNVDYPSAQDYTSFDLAHAAEEAEVDRLNNIVADFPARHNSIVDRLATIHGDIQDYQDGELAFAAALLAEAEALRLEVENQLLAGEITLNEVSATLSVALRREAAGSNYKENTIDITRSSTSCVTRMLVNRENVIAALSMGERQYSVAQEQFQCVETNYDASLSLESELRSSLSATHAQLDFDRQQYIETSIMARSLSTTLSGMVIEGDTLSTTTSTQAETNTNVDFEVNTVSTLRSQIDDLVVPDIPNPIPSLTDRYNEFVAESQDLSTSIRANLDGTISNFQSIVSSGTRARGAINSAIALVAEVSTLRSMCDDALPVADQASTTVAVGESIIVDNAESISIAAQAADVFQATISIQEVDLTELIALLSTVDVTRADIITRIDSVAVVNDALQVSEAAVASFLNAKDISLTNYEATAAMRDASADVQAAAQLSLHSRATTDRDDWCLLLSDTEGLAVDVDGLVSLTAEYSAAVGVARDEFDVLVGSLEGAESIHVSVSTQLSANFENFVAQASALVSLEARLDRDFDLIRCLPAFCLPTI